MLAGKGVEAPAAVPWSCSKTKVSRSFLHVSGGGWGGALVISQRGSHVPLGNVFRPSRIVPPQPWHALAELPLRRKSGMVSQCAQGCYLPLKAAGANQSVAMRRFAAQELRCDALLQRAASPGGFNVAFDRGRCHVCCLNLRPQAEWGQGKGRTSRTTFAQRPLPASLSIKPATACRSSANIEACPEA